ncbi:MAG: hypothetical protein R3D57_07160 [Hyphomicrobiaceae bacterium]
MVKLEKCIEEKFLKSLSEDKAVDAAIVHQLRELFANSNKPKADDFVRIFTSLVDGEVK